MIKDLRVHFEEVARIRDDVLSRTKARPVNEKQFPREISRLNALLARESSSEAYQSVETEVAEGLKDVLAAMPDLEDTAARWRDLTYSEKGDFLESILAVQANLQSAASGISVRPASLKWFNSKVLLGGAYAKIWDRNGEKDEIMLERSNVGSLSQTLSTLVHEQTHVFQSWLGRAVADGKITPDHPLYSDGLHYWIKEQTGAYISAGTIMSSYRRQIEERDANRVGDDIEGLAAFVERKAPRREGSFSPLLTLGLAAGLLLLAGTGNSSRPRPAPAPL